ncbi:MAG: Eco57I restriction-modification methylase domain-containing protein, partial [Desulfomonilaceae bacterium]
ADILLPNDLFSNSYTNREGDRGTGILDEFDRYNFTVREDEPLEKEVAVDPELLGKAYEKFNAIRPNNFEEYREAMKGGKRGTETRFNREFGVYYTPREIVHYMCQQSLVQYLSTELDGKVAQEDIEIFIKSGEQVKENEVRVLAYGRETDTYAFKLPETIRNSGGLINKKLADITVCDPAVGSGAFPVGMMNEIVKARSLLSPYIDDAGQGDRSIYFLKRHCIEHSLYGVDIDPGAIEIAKLRLWLSLVVDEEDIRQIKPLPNLDYKIVCGDSLLGYGYIPRELERVEKLKVEFFDEVKPSRKNELRKEIDDTLHSFFGNTEISLGYQVTMDFRINFSEVFQRKDGFDVVIGNPPYVQIQKFSGQQCQKQWEKQKYKTYLKTGDIYSLFYERGIHLLCYNGVLCFITSNKWMRANYGRQTRWFFLQYTNPLQLIDLGGLSVFESVTVDTNILILQKAKNQNNLAGCQMADDFALSGDIGTYFKTHFVKVKTNTDKTWIISSSKELSIREKIEKAGTPLKEWDISINYGIKTGCNEAFVINGKKKDELIDADLKNTDIIKPILRGRDIKRYKSEHANLWLIATHNGYRDKTGKKIPRIDVVKDYPVIKKHLDQFWDQIFKRQDQGDTPYNLRNCAYMEEFAKEKVVWGNLTLDAQYALASAGVFVSAPSPIMTPWNKYILAVLNSKISDYFIRRLGVTRNGGYFEYKPMFIENVSIPKLYESEQQPFVTLVDEIIQKKENGEETTELEREIDHLVYQLYALTDEEIAIVEDAAQSLSGSCN